ncbi:MAG TPA: MoaD/ThiS family protein [Firmicutes bacterium]|jgi:molybdopterin converting factor small subunit|nr:MoaD/ThiS family protein [Bacillota bacterium]
MIVKLKAFGLASYYMREDLDSVELPAGATINDLLDAVLITDKGRDLSLLSAATFLVNKKSTGRDTVLHDGDEVIFLLPLAGG